jgi:hypothetical protein
VEEGPAGVTATGFVDTYYSINFAQPASRANKYRNFDVSESQFDLALAELVFQKTADPLGFRIDADFGTANDLVQGGTTSTLGILQQAYLSAVVPVGEGLTLDAGKFVTHMGFEVIESKDNWNYSRSLLFAFAIPYYHVGLRAAYPVWDRVVLSGYVSNGWNSFSDNNGSKTVGASVVAAPFEDVTVAAGWIGGVEQPDSVGSGARNVVDATVQYRPTDRLSLAVNGAFGSEDLPSGSVSWHGGALYARYAFSGGTAAAVRLESYDDPDGHTTGVPQRIDEITLTVEQQVLSHLLLRAEYRHDRSSAHVFDDEAGESLLRHQNTVVVGVVLAF